MSLALLFLLLVMRRASEEIGRVRYWDHYLLLFSSCMLICSIFKGTGRAHVTWSWHKRSQEKKKLNQRDAITVVPSTAMSTLRTWVIVRTIMKSYCFLTLLILVP